ncbi:MAG TPA: GNAT family N-acetyltransferase [Candidatus Amulumruptor caecigallinarius]|uniref:GNAT family N-acetyltransferase n=1 Tax=Candidatus Amulumruptor caecigallinarius TaxID=2109911 RepID=A0A921E6S5_9BACT|nr:GNAT family N-acetyltransferase [Candidatus Amulumruptor caecigallinarius]
MTEYTIESAKISDAPAIADAIIAAVTPELCLGLCDDSHGIEDVHAMFEALARRDDSQYSYRNTIVVRLGDGRAAGVLISYDGAMLAPLRRAFIEEYCRHFGTDMDEASIHDETDASEIYLDTLAVIPECRGKGIASALIAEASRRAQSAGKPLGLLVDKHNSKARLLYEKSGFKPVGERFFLNELMDHMQM